MFCMFSRAVFITFHSRLNMANLTIIKRYCTMQHVFDVPNSVPHIMVASHTLSFSMMHHHH